MRVTLAHTTLDHGAEWPDLEYLGEVRYFVRSEQKGRDGEPSGQVAVLE